MPPNHTRRVSIGTADPPPGEPRRNRSWCRAHPDEARPFLDEMRASALRLTEAVLSQPVVDDSPTRMPRPRSRASHRNRPGQRRTRTAASTSSSDDSPPPSEPPPLPVRIVGGAADDSAVRAAFLTILTKRHPGTRWELTA